MPPDGRLSQTAINNINDRMYRADVRPVDLANLIKIDQGHLSRILNRKSPVTLRTIQRICAALSIDVGQLFSGPLPAETLTISNEEELRAWAHMQANQQATLFCDHAPELASALAATGDEADQRLADIVSKLNKRGADLSAEEIEYLRALLARRRAATEQPPTEASSETNR